MSNMHDIARSMLQMRDALKDLHGSARFGCQQTYNNYAADFVDELAEQVLADAERIADLERMLASTSERIAELEAYAVDAAKLLTTEYERANSLERLLWPDGRPGVGDV